MLTTVKCQLYLYYFACFHYEGSRSTCFKSQSFRVQKILKLRLFNQDEKKWHCNVMDMNYEILSISQFTLCYKLKGNKLDFHMAMPSGLAMQNYQYFLDTLRKHYNPNKIKDGAFGEMMEVEIVNDGPVTVQLEFPNPEKCTDGKSDKLGDMDKL
ncbi:D-aminoacyl-tRNA deacylase isoform X2 [Melanaphis sacchari]|uniref:D-aminoacyl-tRNA deacylase isoform X2 n=1 Tax=Melanaphis sacchari TaxID=742174 RepID=UPI000DC156C8|nr:D-aminoacyl-tRNA deacylase isoform X2 [Melanaphis sacchari]